MKGGPGGNQPSSDSMFCTWPGAPSSLCITWVCLSHSPSGSSSCGRVFYSPSCHHCRPPRSSLVADRIECVLPSQSQSQRAHALLLNRCALSPVVKYLPLSPLPLCEFLADQCHILMVKSLDYAVWNHPSSSPPCPGVIGLLKAIGCLLPHSNHSSAS